MITAPGASGVDRIRVLPAELADQIAAGEVVERPASVVKELVENAVDAGATRVEIELEAAGLERIVVVDDGRGIHPDDLELAVTRHATSKVREAADLHEVATLGFRGEALASIAAVAQLVIDTRTADARAGTRLRAWPGVAVELGPIGAAPGTRVEVARLFANVPARRKFVRSSATEIGHVSETVLRLGLVHPHVHLRLRHEGREIVELPASDRDGRVAQVLSRRGADELIRVEREHDGVGVRAWLCRPAAASRSGHAAFVIVRRRVVHERAVSRIVAALYEGRIEPGTQPIACVELDPPVGSVDVNVHPQKAEVRFAEPQRVYAAAREVLRTVDFDGEGAGASRHAPEPAPILESATQARDEGSLPWPDDAHEASAGRYGLRTRAASEHYLADRERVRAQTDSLRRMHDHGARRLGDHRDSAPEPATAIDDGPELIACLPGPIGLFKDGLDLLAVDLRALRAHLVHRRLLLDLGGEGTVAAQALLEPVVLRRSPDDVRLVVDGAPALAEIGLVAEPFGDDAVLIRAVPAALRSCIDDCDVADLIERVLPWLRVRVRVRDAAIDPRLSSFEAIAATRGADPAPRLARRWLRELVAEGTELEAVPGVRRWSARALVEPR